GTYHVYNQTWDEPAHIVAGLEWLQRGAYRFEPLHPPLARIVSAAGPYLAGARLDDDPNPWRQGNRILGSGDGYFRMLGLARAGTLLFFLLACVGVYLVARRAAGPGAGIVAVLLLSTLPPVLAHAGLATTDLALASGTILSFAGFIWWRDAPTMRRGIALGATLGATVLTKFSSLLFLPVVLGSAVLVGRPVTPDRNAALRAVRPVWLTALLLIWIGYRASVGPALPPDDPAASGTSAQSFGLATRIAQLPVYPAPALIQGLAAYAGQSGKGRKAYFMGERGRTGWWTFFPTMFALKTPIAFLALAGFGAVIAIARRREPGTRIVFAATVAAAGCLLVLLPSRVNIGLRHALPIYPLLSVTAAYGAVALWRRGRHRVGAAAAVALIVWQVVAAWRAHPDFLPYFNELAGEPPERYVVDSDLDWGQDLKRLADTLRSRGITDVALAYNGSADPHAVGIERYRILVPFRPDTGWIAISVFTRTLGYWNQPTSDDFAWLERFQPVARAGRSMVLYRIEAGSNR
ncbi:MAG TPA: phospholipid carrier-dependent glycosyltransferase, partial [Gemmatimonadales bacterium]|nr:phospholipid carrier-dependent glycosyltransferase [Gemmatimonadales bacterium]